MSLEKRMASWLRDILGDDGLIVYAEGMTPKEGINAPMALDSHPFLGYELVVRSVSPWKKGELPTHYYNYYKKEKGIG